MVKILWLRNDLRYKDNPALSNLQQSDQDFAILYIINTDQNYQNSTSYPGSSKLYWQLASMEYMSQQCDNKIIIRRGSPRDIFIELSEQIKIDTIYFNLIYEPYWAWLDRQLIELFNNLDIQVSSHDDSLVVIPKPYKRFHYFYKFINDRPQLIKQPYPSQLPNEQLVSYGLTPRSDLIKQTIRLLPAQHNNGIPTVGEHHAMECLKLFLELKLKKYHLKDNLYDEYSSHLSMFIANGNISTRTILLHIANHTGHVVDTQSLTNILKLKRQLIWGAFTSQHLYHYPVNWDNPDWYRKLDDPASHQSWCGDNRHESYKSWCAGRTGYELIDAIMLQLNDSHYINNRARMLVAGFLVHSLNIHWSLGAKYFQKQLIDFDYANNTYNWQFMANIFMNRYTNTIFNIERQQKMYDPHNYYSRVWIQNRKHVTKIPAKLRKEIIDSYLASKGKDSKWRQS